MSQRSQLDGAAQVSRADVGRNEPTKDIVVMVPTKAEFRAIRKYITPLLLNSDFIEPDIDELATGSTTFSKQLSRSNGQPDFTVTLLNCGAMGNVASSAFTAYAVGRYKPTTVISAGIAGSLDPKKAWIGDVVLPSLVETVYINKVYFDAGSIKPKDKTLVLRASADHHIRLVRAQSDLENEAGLGIVDHDLLSTSLAAGFSQFANAAQEELASVHEAVEAIYGGSISVPKTPRIHTDRPVFSWEKVLDSKDLYDHLTTQGFVETDPLSVEMESWGFATMVERLRQIENNRRFSPIIVRAISDIVGAKHSSDKKEKDNEGVCRSIALMSLAQTLAHIADMSYQRRAKRT